MIVRDHSTFAHSPRLNAENRLVRAQELYAPTSRAPYTVTYAYDHRGRMVSKRITEDDGSNSPISILHSTFVWDDWNIIRESVRNGDGSATVTDNVWGLDLDGTMQGAGGVGGLLAVIRANSSTPNSSTHQLFFPTYDANGNVLEYINESGEVVAHYDYSPFGETLIESGALAATFTHRFSTKPWCQVTGLYEYQMRKYRPDIEFKVSISMNEYEQGAQGKIGRENYNNYVYVIQNGKRLMDGMKQLFTPTLPDVHVSDFNTECPFSDPMQ